jgi:23S rRNA pseudouridine2604 synthase
MPSEAIYIAYYKPRGVLCTTEKIPHNIIDAVNFPEPLLPVGRLDKDSEGLILLTNDFANINKIIHPQFAHEKEYIVTLNMPLRNLFLKQMAQGVDIGDAITQACQIKRVPNTKRVFSIVLQQGLNRQIRRMCAVFGYQVLRLQRVRIMHIGIENLQVGQWRHLSEQELKQLYALLMKD